MAECVVCGLAPCDLPDGIDPEAVFDVDDDGQTKCQPHLGPSALNTPGGTQ